jgi:hypothetical protein
MNIEEYARARLAGVSKSFRKRGTIIPMMHYVNGSRADSMVLVPTREAMPMARALLELDAATRVAFISEGWMLRKEGGIPDYEVARIGREGVKNQDGRIEVLMVNAEDHVEGGLLAYAEILRPPPGGPGSLDLGPVVIVPSGSTEGPLTGLLPARGTRQ